MTEKSSYLPGEPIWTDPSQGTSGWVPYFGCADPAAAAEQAEALGGSILLPHTSFAGGSCATRTAQCSGW